MPTLRFRKYNPDGVWAHRVIWWSLVGAVPVCPPVSPCKGTSIVHPRAQCVHFWYGNTAARTFGRAHRHRPYGFVWADCAQKRNGHLVGWNNQSTKCPLRLFFRSLAHTKKHLQRALKAPCRCLKRQTDARARRTAIALVGRLRPLECVLHFYLVLPNKRC